MDNSDVIIKTILPNIDRFVEESESHFTKVFNHLQRLMFESVGGIQIYADTSPFSDS